MKIRTLAGALLLTAALTGNFTACTPTKNNPAQSAAESAASAGKGETTPDGETYTTVDGAAEKMSMTGNTDDVTETAVAIYTIKSDGTGLEQTMDAVDGDSVDAQKLIDKMAELGVIESGIKVNSFKNDNGSLTCDLSSLDKADDELVQTALTNTLLNNLEGKTLTLTVKGKKVIDNAGYVKDYRHIGASTSAAASTTKASK